MYNVNLIAVSGFLDISSISDDIISWFLNKRNGERRERGRAGT